MKKKYIAPELEFNAPSAEDILNGSMDTDLATGGIWISDDIDAYLTYLQEGNLAEAAKYYQ